jgi:hypothetical protein
LRPSFETGDKQKPRMNDLIQRIVNAVVRQEGEPATAHNAGNLRGAPWLPQPVPMMGGFWYPGTRAEGLAGLAHLVTLHIAQGNTLRDFIGGHPGVYAGFAPSADNNNVDAYVRDVMQWAGIADSNIPMWTYITD